MIIWRLKRFAYLPTGTLGRLVRPEGAQTLYTVERPWRNNEPFESCIPEGEYILHPFSGNRWKDVLEVASVPNRTFILIHPGNTPSDIQGCIAPGTDWLIDKGSVPRVHNSRAAFNALQEDFAENTDGTGISISSVNSKRG